MPNGWASMQANFHELNLSCRLSQQYRTSCLAHSSRSDPFFINPVIPFSVGFRQYLARATSQAVVSRYLFRFASSSTSLQLQRARTSDWSYFFSFCQFISFPSSFCSQTQRLSMATTPNASLDLLPPEVLHRILDYLDTSTILFGIRPVCRRFRSIATTYNRFNLDFRSVSQQTLRISCRLVPPFNVASLILSNDQHTPKLIDQFISLVHLRRFTCLRSITLLDVTEGQMNFILKRVNTDSVRSFSIRLTKYDDRRKKTTKQLFQFMLTNPHLHALSINSISRRLMDVSWPTACSLRCCTIDEQTSFADLCSVLQHSPSLHTLVLKKTCRLTFDILAAKPSASMIFPQLKSFTIENFDFTMDQLEQVLSCTPSLHHLKLLGTNEPLDAQRWENFVQVNLPQLEKFEFHLHLRRFDMLSLEEMEASIIPFRSPFWIEHKNWYVARTRRPDHSYAGRLYSLPNCSPTSYYYAKNTSVMVVSTHPATSTPCLSRMDQIQSLELYVDDALIKEIREEVSDDQIRGRQCLYSFI